MISFRVNQNLVFPQLDLIFIWAKQKWNWNGILDTRVQIALLSFGFGLVENQSRGLYLEEMEPAQILKSTEAETLAVVWHPTLVNSH